MISDSVNWKISKHNEMFAVLQDERFIVKITPSYSNPPHRQRYQIKVCLNKYINHGGYISYPTSYGDKNVKHGAFKWGNYYSLGAAITGFEKKYSEFREFVKDEVNNPITLLDKWLAEYVDPHKTED